jgi:hypothetical protein
MNGNNIITESGIIRLSDSMWNKARHRAEVISEIAEREIISTPIAVEAARKLNLSERTVYRLVRRWRESGGSVTALVSQGSNGGNGGSRLSTCGGLTSKTAWLAFIRNNRLKLNDFKNSLWLNLIDHEIALVHIN